MEKIWWIIGGIIFFLAFSFVVIALTNDVGTAASESGNSMLCDVICSRVRGNPLLDFVVNPGSCGC